MSEKQEPYNAKPASAILPVKKSEALKTYNTKYDTDFSQAADDYWFDIRKGKEYHIGHMLGKYGKKDVSVPNFFNRIFLAIKEILYNELSMKEMSTEEFKTHLACLENMFNMIAQQLETKFKMEAKNIEGVNLFAMLHGFTNGLIDSMKDKLENTKQQED